MPYTGVCARGIVTPIFKSGDDLVTAVCDSVCRAAEHEGFALRDGDIVADGVVSVWCADVKADSVDIEDFAVPCRAQRGRNIEVVI